MKTKARTKKEKERFKSTKEILANGNWRVAMSCLIMGFGQLTYKQIGKGIAYLLVQAATIVYFVMYGAGAIAGFFTLGTVRANPWMGIEGDNSVLMMLMGILSFIILIVYLYLYLTNIKDCYETQKVVESGKKPVGFLRDIKNLFDKSFYKTALFLPILGVSIFCVLPIIFMILIAFTNYGGDILPPDLVDWSVGSWIKLLTLKEFSSTFLRILAWNMVWAVASTTINYFAGLGLALLYNKKCVRPKIFWRVFPIIAYAVPGFITLLGFKFMFAYGGPINQIIESLGSSPIGFLDQDAKWSARTIGLLVNAWICIPSGMLLATGILSNLNKDLYEAAKIDGAKPFRQFTAITLPFVIFATTPVLISQFIGNFNNFGIFFFLRGAFVSEGYFLASDTDLLINWLYNLSINNEFYSIGASISIVIFAITSIISLLVYTLSPSYKQEDTFR